MEKFIVSNSPFIRSKNDINRMFLSLSIALLVLSIYGVVVFGIKSLMVIGVSIVCCYVFECLFNLITKKQFKTNNLSFLVTALILALTLPYKTPVYVVIASAFVAIFIVKMCFGGLGRNKFNPALVGRCFAGVLASGLASELYTITINGEEYLSLASGGTNSLSNLIMGNSVGGIGTTCILLIFVCFVFLVYAGVIDFKIPFFAIITYLGVSLISHNIEVTISNMCAGSFLFIAVFMLPDPNTSPNTNLGKIIYSCLFGGVSALLWHMGTLGENALFILALVVNLLVPFMDKYFTTKPISLGGVRNAH